MHANTPAPAFLDAFHRRAGPGGRLRFDAYVDLALFDPDIGYYTAPRPRVGRAAGTDFYTAVSVGRDASGAAPAGGTLLGRLVAGAAARLAAPHTGELVEIGAEPGAGVFDGVAHAFAAVRSVRRGEPWRPPEPGGAVFANEVLDAQPFRRVVRRGGVWREVEVAEADGRLVEVDGAEARVPVALPEASEGTALDLPLAAADVAAGWAAGTWPGVLLLADYGVRWDDLCANPRSTARGYRGHRQVADLLDSPGAMDLTCHVCWDWVERAVRAAGWDRVRVVSQEAFLVREGAPELEAFVAGEVAPLERFRRARQVQELLHPGHLGRKFQVLVAQR